LKKKKNQFPENPDEFLTNFFVCCGKWYVNWKNWFYSKYGVR
jgi:hypothetical protein